MEGRWCRMAFTVKEEMDLEVLHRYCIFLAFLIIDLLADVPGVQKCS